MGEEVGGQGWGVGLFPHLGDVVRAIREGHLDVDREALGLFPQIGRGGWG